MPRISTFVYGALFCALCLKTIDGALIESAIQAELGEVRTGTVQQGHQLVFEFSWKVWNGTVEVCCTAREPLVGA